jgi:ABC-type polysaccharide/polyol phosphate export permease
MPFVVQVIARLIPVTSAIEITRDLMTGKTDWRMLWNLLYIIVAALVTMEIALRSLRRRLVN